MKLLPPTESDFLAEQSVRWAQSGKRQAHDCTLRWPNDRTCFEYPQNKNQQQYHHRFELTERTFEYLRGVWRGTFWHRNTRTKLEKTSKRSISIVKLNGINKLRARNFMFVYRWKLIVKNLTVKWNAPKWWCVAPEHVRLSVCTKWMNVFLFIRSDGQKTASAAANIHRYCRLHSTTLSVHLLRWSRKVFRFNSNVKNIWKIKRVSFGAICFRLYYSHHPHRERERVASSCSRCTFVVAIPSFTSASTKT